MSDSNLIIQFVKLGMSDSSVMNIQLVKLRMSGSNLNEYIMSEVRHERSELNEYSICELIRMSDQSLMNIQVDTIQKLYITDERFA